MRYTKPFLDIPGQMQRLESRGLNLGDRDLSQQALEQIGYYRLSAYWYPFREIRHDVRTDDFRTGATMRDTVSIYVFDKKLRLLVLDAIERIEIALRTDVTLTLARHGAWAHRDPANLHGNFSSKVMWNGQTRHQTWLENIDRCEQRSKDEFADHFRTKYTSERHLPMWISVEVWELGALSHLLAGMKYKDQMALAQKYGLADQKLLPSWTRTLTFVRNVCAHHGRLWNRSMIDQPKFPKTGQNPNMDHIAAVRSSQERLYGTLVILAYLVKSLNPRTQWHRRVVELVSEFPDSPLVSLASAGFPADWENEAIWSA